LYHSCSLAAAKNDFFERKATTFSKMYGGIYILSTSLHYDRLMK